MKRPFQLFMMPLAGFLPLCFLLCLLLSACGKRHDAAAGLSLDGVWVLKKMVAPIGTERDYSDEALRFYQVYEGDTVLHHFQLQPTAAGMVVVVGASDRVSLIHQGGGQYLYVEGDEPRPLTVVDDTTITIQRFGRLYTMVRATDITRQQTREICNIIHADRENDGNEQVRHYVMSTTEQRLRTENVLLASVVTIALLIIIIGTCMIKAKQRRIKQAEERIRQMAEQREQRAQPVTRAIHDVEKAFFASDYYQSLRRKFSDDSRLSNDDWQEAERRLCQVYPGFTTSLRSLYRMSEMEERVCLLIKLRFAPSEIAQLLARDSSSISSTRSRLFRKVFGRNGSPRDWDDVVLGIGS